MKLCIAMIALSGILIMLFCFGCAAPPDREGGAARGGREPVFIDPWPQAEERPGTIGPQLDELLRQGGPGRSGKSGT